MSTTYRFVLTVERIEHYGEDGQRSYGIADETVFVDEGDLSLASVPLGEIVTLALDVARNDAGY